MGWKRSANECNKNAVVPQAVSDLLYQNAKRQNGGTTIIHMKRWSVVDFRVSCSAAMCAISLRLLLFDEK
jgi:hypothetical protein